MASNVFSVNVYQIGTNQAFQDPKLMAFPSTQVIFEEVQTVETAFNSSTRLYGSIQVIPSGLNINSPSYLTVETVAQLVQKANN
jgi:hypothetical protein